MSDFLQDADGTDMHNISSVIENFQKKNNVGSMGSLATGVGATPTVTLAAGKTAGNHMVSYVYYIIMLWVAQSMCEYHRQIQYLILQY